MSFLSHIGLSVIDKLTGNALDKLGNAIKDGDVSGIVEQFTDILEGVEDKLGDASDLFEEAIESGKKDIRREIAQVKRKLVRETRKELADDARRVPRSLGAEDFRTGRGGSREAAGWRAHRLILWARRKRNPNAAQALRSRYRPSRWPGLRRTKPSWQSLVQEDGVQILEYELKQGNSLEFRVGGTVEAFMERVGPAPDKDMFVDAMSTNAESISIEYEHALSGPQKKSLGPGSRLTVNCVLARHWKFTAPNWE